VTIEDEDKLDIEENPKEDPGKMVSIAHYIMMHYAEKESVKRNKGRSTNLRQANTAWKPD
jgi:hypothetical protein